MCLPPNSFHYKNNGILGDCDRTTETLVDFKFYGTTRENAITETISSACKSKLNERKHKSIHTTTTECRPKKCRSAHSSKFHCVRMCFCVRALCVWLCFWQYRMYVRTEKCVLNVYLINTIWIELHSSFFSLCLTCLASFRCTLPMPVRGCERACMPVCIYVYMRPCINAIVWHPFNWILNGYTWYFLCKYRREKTRIHHRQTSIFSHHFDISNTISTY